MSREERSIRSRLDALETASVDRSAMDVKLQTAQKQLEAVTKERDGLIVFTTKYICMLNEIHSLLTRFKLLSPQTAVEKCLEVLK